VAEEQPIDWLVNEHARATEHSAAVDELLPPGTFRLPAAPLPDPGYRSAPEEPAPPRRHDGAGRHLG